VTAQGPQPSFTIAKVNRWFAAALMALVVCLIVLSVPQARTSVLQRAGSLLVSEDDVGPSDAVALFTGIGPVGVLEVLDLLNERRTRRAVIIQLAPGPEMRELERRGLRLETSAARTARLLRQAAISEIVIETITVDEGGTNAEAVALKRWCMEQGIDSIIVIATRDHSARARRVLSRTFKESDTRVFVKIARHDSFDPWRWWQRRDSLRVGIIELQKLLLEYLCHPLA